MQEKSKQKYCTPNCSNAGHIKEYQITGAGYKRIFRPNHPKSDKNGHILEHRFLMNELFGGDLKEFEHIHHIDFNKGNNSINNLMVLSGPDHRKLHQFLEHRK